VNVSVGSGVRLGVGVLDGFGEDVRVGVMVAVRVGVKVGYRVGMICLGVFVIKGVGEKVAVCVTRKVSCGSTLRLILTKAYPNP
jgi:hypothetical protein